MDTFTPLDMAAWPRRGIYKLYTEQWTTTLFSTTKRIDISNTVEYANRLAVKLVPALYWVFTKNLAASEAFTLAFHEGQLGHWDSLHPLYPVLRQDGNFSFHTIEYTPDYIEFYDRYLAEAEKPERDPADVYPREAPENVYNISVMPYMDFDAFSFSLKNARNYFLPVITLGKYQEQEDGQILMPCAVTVNHAATDGRHVYDLLEAVEWDFACPEIWMTP